MVRRYTTEPIQFSFELSVVPSTLIGSEQLGLTGSTTTAGSGGVQKNVASDVSIVSSASGITLQDDGGSGG